MKLSGLYTLTNTVNGKYYFGSSRDLKRRECEHFSHLGHNRSGHRKLQEAFNISGLESFVFEVVLLAPVELLPVLEESVLQELRPEYNSSLSYNGFKGMSHSEEAKKKISEFQKGEKHYNFGKPAHTIRPVIQKDLDGLFIAEYASISEASKNCKVNHGNICSTCSGRIKNAGGFKWSYKI